MSTMKAAEVRIVADTGPESDERELLNATQQLRQMLLRQRVEQVTLAYTDGAPDGSKGTDLVVLGTVLVTLAPHVITGVVTTVQAWAERSAGRSANLVLGEDSLELTGLSQGQQQQLIDEFLQRTSNAGEEGTSDGAA
ncbi:MULTISPECIES: hypothetical protein [unclassified Streptomyces]|uniref:hypothetical protein n=1 Tax=unclassified Streptomyces TaxID=2593676 RepID=UPI00386D8FF0|nr:hypothetical protein OG569_03485 [Streptomyces sp. NBC_00827]